MIQPLCQAVLHGMLNLSRDDVLQAAEVASDGLCLEYMPLLLLRVLRATCCICTMGLAGGLQQGLQGLGAGGR
jgi:hypothetical protein